MPVILEFETTTANENVWVSFHTIKNQKVFYDCDNDNVYEGNLILDGSQKPFTCNIWIPWKHIIKFKTSDESKNILFNFQTENREESNYVWKLTRVLSMWNINWFPTGTFSWAKKLTEIRWTENMTIAKTWDDNGENSDLYTNLNSTFAETSSLKLIEWVENFDVSWVTSLFNTFYNSSFNQDISNWNVSNVKQFVQTFWWNKIFNQPLDSWNVWNWTHFQWMFRGTKRFNQPLNNWNVSNAVNMWYMFEWAREFNQPLDKWNVYKVDRMNNMFEWWKYFPNISDWETNWVDTFENFTRNNEWVNWDKFPKNMQSLLKIWEIATSFLIRDDEWEIYWKNGFHQWKWTEYLKMLKWFDVNWWSYNASLMNAIWYNGEICEDYRVEIEALKTKLAQSDKNFVARDTWAYVDCTPPITKVQLKELLDQVNKLLENEMKVYFVNITSDWQNIVETNGESFPNVTYPNYSYTEKSQPIQAVLWMIRQDYAQATDETNLTEQYKNLEKIKNAIRIDDTKPTISYTNNNIILDLNTQLDLYNKFTANEIEFVKQNSGLTITDSVGVNGIDNDKNWRGNLWALTLLKTNTNLKNNFQYLASFVDNYENSTENPTAFNVKVIDWTLVINATPSTDWYSIKVEATHNSKINTPLQISHKFVDNKSECNHNNLDGFTNWNIVNFSNWENKDKFVCFKTEDNNLLSVGWPYETLVAKATVEKYLELLRNITNKFNDDRAYLVNGALDETEMEFVEIQDGTQIQEFKQNGYPVRLKSKHSWTWVDNDMVIEYAENVTNKLSAYVNGKLTRTEEQLRSLSIGELEVLYNELTFFNNSLRIDETKPNFVFTNNSKVIEKSIKRFSSEYTNYLNEINSENGLRAILHANLDLGARWNVSDNVWVTELENYVTIWNIEYKFQNERQNIETRNVWTSPLRTGIWNIREDKTQRNEGKKYVLKLSFTDNYWNTSDEIDLILNVTDEPITINTEKPNPYEAIVTATHPSTNNLFYEVVDSAMTCLYDRNTYKAGNRVVLPEWTTDKKVCFAIENWFVVAQSEEISTATRDKNPITIDISGNKYEKTVTATHNSWNLKYAIVDENQTCENIPEFAFTEWNFVRFANGENNNKRVCFSTLDNSVKELSEVVNTEEKRNILVSYDSKFGQDTFTWTHDQPLAWKVIWPNDTCNEWNGWFTMWKVAIFTDTTQNGNMLCYKTTDNLIYYKFTFRPINVRPILKLQTTGDLWSKTYTPVHETYTGYKYTIIDANATCNSRAWTFTNANTLTINTPEHNGKKVCFVEENNRQSVASEIIYIYTPITPVVEGNELKKVVSWNHPTGTVTYKLADANDVCENLTDYEVSPITFEEWQNNWKVVCMKTEENETTLYKKSEPITTKTTSPIEVNVNGNDNRKTVVATQPDNLKLFHKIIEANEICDTSWTFTEWNSVVFENWINNGKKVCFKTENDKVFAESPIINTERERKPITVDVNGNENLKTVTATHETDKLLYKIVNGNEVCDVNGNYTEWNSVIFKDGINNGMKVCFKTEDNRIVSESPIIETKKKPISVEVTGSDNTKIVTATHETDKIMHKIVDWNEVCENTDDYLPWNTVSFSNEENNGKKVCFKTEDWLAIAESPIIHTTALTNPIDVNVEWDDFRKVVSATHPTEKLFHKIIDGNATCDATWTFNEGSSVVFSNGLLNWMKVCFKTEDNRVVAESPIINTLDPKKEINVLVEGNTNKKTVTADIKNWDKETLEYKVIGANDVCDETQKDGFTKWHTVIFSEWVNNGMKVCFKTNDWKNYAESPVINTEKTVVITPPTNWSSSGPGGYAPSIPVISNDNRVTIPTIEQPIITAKPTETPVEEPKPTISLPSTVEETKPFVMEFIDNPAETITETVSNVISVFLPATGSKIKKPTPKKVKAQLETKPNTKDFSKKGSTNTDLHYWTDGKDGNYVVIPSEGLVVPLGEIDKETSRTELGKMLTFNALSFDYMAEKTRIIGWHSSYYKGNQFGKYKAHFQKLIGLKTETEIWVYEYWMRKVYTVNASYEIKWDKFSFSDEQDKLILFTCTPIGGISGRWIVEAKLKSID